MFDGGEALFNADVSQVVLEFLISELSSIVGYYKGRYPESCQDVPFEETEYVFGCDFRQWFGFDPLG